jgi:3-oxoacyl-[acyl-carrier protein] reductase
MKLDLIGKHALVCGGSQGIGLAAAQELAELGADLTLLARSRESLEQALSTLTRKTSAQRHGFVVADMTKHDALRAQIEGIASAGPLHIIVNNTGGPASGTAHAAAPEAYLAAFNQHLIAAQIVLQAALPGMQGAGYGRIINVISTSVKEPIANLGVSNTIRGAMASWAKTLSRELGPSGITVNNVLPGYTRTQRLEQILQDRVASTGQTVEAVANAMLSTVPARRFAEASEIASVIAFLASPAAAYVNGVNIPVDGGRTQSL